MSRVPEKMTVMSSVILITIVRRVWDERAWREAGAEVGDTLRTAHPVEAEGRGRQAAQIYNLASAASHCADVRVLFLLFSCEGPQPGACPTAAHSRGRARRTCGPDRWFKTIASVKIYPRAVLCTQGTRVPLATASRAYVYSE